MEPSASGTYGELNRRVAQGKLRCDHQRPICTRCRNRGMGNRCYYHPAPLTKSRDTVTCSNGESAGVISTPQLLLSSVGDEMLLPPTQLPVHGITHDERLSVVKVRQRVFLLQITLFRL
jgi:hypothetical protein